jgi:hypothetical protein
MRVDLVITGAPGTTRTCDRRIRSPVLYPSELQGHSAPVNERVDDGTAKLATGHHTRPAESRPWERYVSAVSVSLSVACRWAIQRAASSASPARKGTIDRSTAAHSV